MIQSKMAPAKTPVVASGVVGGGLIGDARAAVTGALSGGYDTTQFIPRVASLPESAPAFDAVRVVSAMPMVIGGMCVAEKCRCYTQQNTLVAMSDNECRQLITNPLFNPYQVARNETSTKGEKAIGHQSPVAAAALPLAPPSMTTKAL
jgi:zona occludens toxin